MANLTAHVHFGKKVLEALPPEALTIAAKHKDAFIYGCIGPDFLFVLRELGDKAARYCNEMQYNNAYEVFTSIAGYLKKEKDGAMLSYALGLVCHYVLDFNIHPFVNYFMEEGKFKEVPACQQCGIHALIENALDTYIATKRMGYADSNLYKPYNDIKLGRNSKMAIASLYINSVNDIVGFDVSPFKIYLSIFLTRLTMRIVTDKRGYKRKFFAWLERNNTGGKKTVRNLMRPPECYDEADLLNFTHRPYRVVRNREETSTRSAIEVFDDAVPQAVKYVCSLIGAVEGKNGLDKKDFIVNYEGVAV